MARYVRFIVHQKNSGGSQAGKSQHVGLFAAGYALLECGELFPHDRKRLEELLAWFSSKLGVPPSNKISPQAIFWYDDVGPFSGRMWELAYILNDHNYTTELITANFIGRAVYQDEYQVAAIPPRKRNHR